MPSLLLTSFGLGPFPGLISIGLMSSCGCPTCRVLLRTWPALLHPSPVDGHSHRQAPPRHREACLQNAASDFLGLTVFPCHHPPDTCDQRDSRRPQRSVRTDAKLWFPVAPGLKSSLVVASWAAEAQPLPLECLHLQASCYRALLWLQRTSPELLLASPILLDTSSPPRISCSCPFRRALC